MIKTVILTISDTRTKETDVSGKAIERILAADKNFVIAAYDLVPDEKEKIKEKFIFYADHVKADLVLTNGGTGLATRDVTPEATMEVIDRVAPGLAEFIRLQGAQKTKRALLSRGIAGVRSNTLMVNLPGSPKGVEESLQAILDVLPHALDMIRGKGH